MEPSEKPQEALAARGDETAVATAVVGRHQGSPEGTSWSNRSCS